MRKHYACNIYICKWVQIKDHLWLFLLDFMLYKLNCIIIKSCNTLKEACHLLWNCNQWITKGKGEPTLCIVH